MQPISLFYSYAHEDEPLRDELQGHLGILQRRGVLDAWYDRDILPSTDWADQIDRRLQSADIVLLLVSADFIASDYIWGRELQVALSRHASGEAAVIPVLVRAVDIEDAPFAHLQGLPTDLRPVTSWTNRDEAWTNVAKGVRRTVNDIRSRRAAPGDTGSGAPTAAPPVRDPEFAGERADDMAADFSVGEADAPGPAGGDFGDLFAAPPGDVPARRTPVADDPLLRQAVTAYGDRIDKAAEARGTPGGDRHALERQAEALLDIPDPRRVLWVDDQPSNNRFETAALARLQIEVVQDTGTESALARLREARDGAPEDRFDLVISDWTRLPAASPDEPEGLRLLRRMREEGFATPVVYYHGEFAADRRRRRAERARRAGALGEAVRPDELMALTLRALSG